jgi:hypothetical protein
MKAVNEPVEKPILQNAAARLQEFSQASWKFLRCLVVGCFYEAVLEGSKGPGTICLAVRRCSVQLQPQCVDDFQNGGKAWVAFS